MNIEEYLVEGLMIGNLVILIILMWIYGGNYRKFKSSFALGLLLFSLFLFFQGISNILSRIYYAGIVDGVNPLLETLHDLIPLFEFIALSILLKITWK